MESAYNFGVEKALPGVTPSVNAMLDQARKDISSKSANWAADKIANGFETSPDEELMSMVRDLCVNYENYDARKT